MAHTPLQRRVILGLESGAKLMDVLREPGMPRKDMVEEWLDNPEFDADYRVAAEKGKAIRLKKGGSQSPEDTGLDRRPAVLREARPVPPEKARSQREPIGLDDDPEVGAAPAPAHPLEADGPEPGPVEQPALARKKNGRPQAHSDAQLKAIILGGLAQGFKIADIIRVTRGLSATRLAQLRKDNHFVLKYDEAKKKGKDKMPPAATPGVPAPHPLDLVPKRPYVSGFDGLRNYGVDPYQTKTATESAEMPAAAPAVRQTRYLVMPETDELCFPDLVHAIESAKGRALNEGHGFVVVEIVCTAKVRTTVELVE